MATPKRIPTAAMRGRFPRFRGLCVWGLGGLFRSVGSVGSIAFLGFASSLSAMTLVVGNTDLEPGHVTAITDSGGRLVPSGSGFVAVGAFGDLSDDAIRSAGESREGMQGLLGQFQSFGDSHRFGLGPGLERVDGVFQMAPSVRTNQGDPFVGRPIYVIGGDERGMFVYRSALKFEVDYPVATGSVDLWGGAAAVAAGLLVGEVGESVEVLELGSGTCSVKLAASPDGLLDWSAIEENLAPMEPPVPAPLLAEPAPPKPEVLPESKLAEVELPKTIGSVGDLPAADPGGGESSDPPGGSMELPFHPVIIRELQWWLPPDEGVLTPGVISFPWVLERHGYIESDQIFLQSTAMSRMTGSGVMAFGALVPEPGSLILAACGWLVLGGRRRRSAEPT